MQVKLQTLTLLWYCFLAYLSLSDFRPLFWIFLIYLQQSIGFPYALAHLNGWEEEPRLHIDSLLAMDKENREVKPATNSSQKKETTTPPSFSTPLRSSRTKPRGSSTNSTSNPVQSSSHQQEEDVFSGSGFVTLSFPIIQSTTYRHVVALTSKKTRFPESKVMLTLLNAKKANEIKIIFENVFSCLNEGWMPIYEVDCLKENQYYLCTPYFPVNVSNYLQKQTKLSVNEAKHLSMFIVMQTLKLEQMSMGFQEKFNFDYLFLKDEQKGITFDNLIMGGYHAITLLDPASSTSLLHSSYLAFLNALLSITKNACQRPLFYTLWSFPLKQIHQVHSIHELNQILDMLAIDVLYPTTSSPSP